MSPVIANAARTRFNTAPLPIDCPMRMSADSLLVIVLASLLSGSNAGATESAPSWYRGQSIFPDQPKHVHSSSIVELPDGGFFAVWFHGSGERTADDVVIQGARLRDGASQWDTVFLAADTPGLPDCNPVVFLDGRQRLWLVWVVVQANRWEQSLLKYRVASEYEPGDAPRWEWQDVILLRPGAEFPNQLRAGFSEWGYSQRMWAEYARPYDRLLIEAAADPVKRDIGWMPRALPLHLGDGPRQGRILLPLYSDGFNISLMAISDDDGAHWRPSQPVVGLGNVQPTLARRTNGSLVAYFRDAGLAPGRVQMSESHDHGETWSVARDTELSNPGSSLAVVTLADGRWLMVLNDTETGRHQLAVMVSRDEGRQWHRLGYLEQSPPGGVAMLIRPRSSRATGGST
jgi:hypothetical protein